MNHAIKVMAMAILLFGINILFAQGEGRHHQRVHRSSPLLMIDRIGSVVELTEPQQEELNVIKENYKTKLEDLKNQDFNNREEHREVMKGLLENLKEEVNNVLTLEQQSQLEEARQENRQKRKEWFESIDHEAMHEEIKTYNEMNIQPVMIEQRKKLDEVISEEDQELLATLRTTMMPLKKEGKEKLKGRRSKENKPELTEEQKENRAQLKGLIEKYSEDIKLLMEEIDDDREVWESDIKAIRLKYLPEELKKDDRPEGLHGNRGKHFRKQKMHFRHAAGFLLMDPNAEKESNIDFLEEPGVNSLKLYPNPSNSVNRLEYDLQISGNTRIELRRENGTVEKILIDNYQDAGQQILDVDVSNLKSGVYYITITDSNGMTYTEKMIVNN